MTFFVNAFLNANRLPLQRIDLSKMTRDECNQQLIMNGFDERPTVPETGKEDGEL